MSLEKVEEYSVRKRTAKEILYGVEFSENDDGFVDVLEDMNAKTIEDVVKSLGSKRSDELQYLEGVEVMRLEGTSVVNRLSGLIYEGKFEEFNVIDLIVFLKKFIELGIASHIIMANIPEVSQKFYDLVFEFFEENRSNVDIVRYENIFLLLRVSEEF